MTIDSPDTFASPAPSPSGRRRWFAIGAGIVVLLGVLIWVIATRLPAWLTATDSPAATGSASTTGGGDSARRIKATLFYVSSDGTALTGVGREVLHGATPAEQARHIVEAQVKAPPSGTRSAIPEGTTVRAVFLTDANEAYVDLGGAIATGHTGGSLDEALAIYAIVNAITANLTEVISVQILIEGKEVDTLAGHIDLRYPLGRAPEWVQKGQ